MQRVFTPCVLLLGYHPNMIKTQTVLTGMASETLQLVKFCVEIHHSEILPCKTLRVHKETAVWGHGRSKCFRD